MKTSIKKQTVACNQCDCQEYRVIASDKDREYPDTSNDVFHIVQCASCGLYYLNPRPALSELHVIYPNNYQAYNIRKPRSGVTKGSFVTRLRHTIYSKRFQLPLKYLKNHSQIDLLDIGCGDGWQLDLYKRLAPNRINTYGVEIREEACEVAKSFGHTTYCGLFENIDFGGKQFNLINLSQVIEHVADPKDFMRCIAKVLKPGGILALETPNTATLDARIFRSRHWGAYHFPRHWTLYDPTSIRRLAESTGFNVLEMAFTPSPVHWVWTCHSILLARGGIAKKFGEWLFSPLGVFRGSLRTFALLSVFTIVDLIFRLTTGQTSNMVVVLQKPTE